MSACSYSCWIGLLVVASMALANAGEEVEPLFRPDIRFDPPPNEDVASYLGRMRQVVQLFKDRPEFVDEWNLANERTTLGQKDVYVPFTCTPIPPSETVPTTAHAVRPGDIKVIGALGDSITAANGVRARRALEVIVTNRGESWSIGGERSLDDHVLTLPNILRHYNEDIIGASDCRRGQGNTRSGLNVAVPGHTNRNMEAQAVELMTLMLENPEIDYWNDWKLITIFIGGNDLCQFCENEAFSAEAYFQGIKAALDKFKTHLPRAIINLQPMFDVSVLEDLSFPGISGRAFCNAMHGSLCPCLAEYGREQRQLQLEYFTKMEMLTDGRYDTRQDFTVVLQPHMKDLVPFKFLNGSYDMSFVAPDCFHPSHKAHQMFAFMLWNTMFTPVGQKTTNYEVGHDEELHYVCPTTDRPYIFTNKNSNVGSAASAENDYKNGVEQVTSGFLSFLAASILAFVHRLM